MDVSSSPPKILHLQRAIFADLISRVVALPIPDAATIVSHLHHASGGLPDLAMSGELSDVDISVAHGDPHELLGHLQQAYATCSHAKVVMDDYNRDQDYAIIAVQAPMYSRPVHVYVSTNALTGVAHRLLELKLNTKYPRLAIMAMALKRYANMSTEQAWYNVLDLGPADPGHHNPWYDVLLDEERALKAAEARNLWLEEYVDHGGLPKE